MTTRPPLWRTAPAAALAAIAEMGSQGPLVWANGDAWPDGFRARATMPHPGPPARYGLGTCLAEHPAPWCWDLLQAVGGLVAMRTPSSDAQVQRLTLQAFGRYRDAMAATVSGEGTHSTRIYLQDLPLSVRDLLEAAADADAPAAPAVGTSAPEVGQRLQTALRLPVVDCVFTPEPDGRRRWSASIASSRRRSASIHRIAICERQTPLVATLVPARDLLGGTLAWPRIAQADDPWLRVLPGGHAGLLAWTQAPADLALDVESIGDDELPDLVRLWAVMLADAHLRGADALGQDRAAVASALAEAAAAEAPRLAHAMPALAIRLR